MSDYVIMVKNQAKVFLGGPPLVKMATGEEVDDERYHIHSIQCVLAEASSPKRYRSLGGADMHSRISGVSDFLAVNEHDGILKARQIVHNLHWRKSSDLPRFHFSDHVEEPFYDPGMHCIASLMMEGEERHSRDLQRRSWGLLLPIYASHLTCVK